MTQSIDLVVQRWLVSTHHAQAVFSRPLHPYVDLVTQSPLIDAFLGS
jgi:hypothetical protein